MHNAKLKLDALQKKRDTEAILATLSVPQYHSSFKAATELLCDPRRNGETDGRRVLRERFAFHREKQRPGPLAQHPASAPAGGGGMFLASSSSSRALSVKSSGAVPPKFLEPIASRKRSGHTSRMEDAKGDTGSPSLNTTMNSHAHSSAPGTAASSSIGLGRGAGGGVVLLTSSSPALAEFSSLTAIHEAFAPKWKHLVEREKADRKDTERDHSIVLESMLKDLSRTIDIEKMVRPEVAASLGLSINVRLPNYLEEEYKRFVRAHDRLIGSETLHRGELEDMLLREFAALRRSSVRKLRTLQQQYDARIAAAAQEVAMQLQLQREQRLAQIAHDITCTLDQEVVDRFVTVELVEFSARHEMDFKLNAQWGTCIRVTRKQHFDAMIVAHHALSGEERQCREALEAEEKNAALTALRDASLELDKGCLVFSIGQRMLRLVEQEDRLRSPRESRLMISHAAAIVESSADLLLEAYSASAASAWSSIAWVWAKPTFVSFCESEQRAALHVEQAAWCEDLTAQVASAGSIPTFMISCASLTEGGANRFFTNTPTSDVMDPPAARSALSSRQQSSRRPLWSAGGNSGRVSRVPTPDAAATRTPVMLRSRQSSALGSRGAQPPLPTAKMDL